MNTAAVTLGCRMPPHRSYDERLADLERELKEEKEKTRPLVEFYNTGTVIGKMLWILGGIVVAGAGIYAAIMGHGK